MESLNDKISKVYNDKSGFGSLKQTISDVKRYFPEIKRADVEKWYKNNVAYTILNRGSNYFVVSEALRIFQIDLFYMDFFNKKEGDVFNIAVGCIDIFSKHAVVIGISNKTVKHTFRRAEASFSN